MTDVLSAVEIEQLVHEILDPTGFHERLKDSIGYAVTGVMHGDRLTLHGIACGTARARGTQPKHALKALDRLLSNWNLQLDRAFGAWVPWLVGKRETIVVTMDWTEYAAQGHSRIALNLVTQHGRATPLLWETVETASLYERRNMVEDAVLGLLKEYLPAGVHVTVLADRGFGDTALYRMLQEELGFDFVIRSRGNVHLYPSRAASAGKPIKAYLPTRSTEDAAMGATADAADAASADAASRPHPLVRFDEVELTAARVPVQSVILTHDQGMKEPWYLVVRDTRNRSTEQLVQLYGMRFTCEETFRDEQNLRFGMGLDQVAIRDTERRDRLLFIFAIAWALLTLLGASGEAHNADRMLKANTVKRRTHSLFQQGRAYLQGSVARFHTQIRDTFFKLLSIHKTHTNIFGFL